MGHCCCLFVEKQNIPEIYSVVNRKQWRARLRHRHQQLKCCRYTKMDNLLEVCEEMGLEVEYLSLKERGAFAFPMKETIRAFNMSEDDPKTVTIVRDKNDIANMKMSATLYNRRLYGERVLSAPEQDSENDIGLLFCNGVVHAWDHVKSDSEWRTFLEYCATTEEWLCTTCNTPDVPATQVVSCTECFHWLCRKCAVKLAVGKCPKCNKMGTLCSWD